MRLSALVACSVFWTLGCRTALPTVPPPTLLAEHTHVTKIVIGADIDDRALLCVEVTPAMRAEWNTRDLERCGATVGELRAQFVHLSSAN